MGQASVTGHSPQVSICYVINNVAFFASHRLPIAIAAAKSGYSVRLITGQAGSLARETEGNTLVDQIGLPRARAAFTSDGTNPFRELLGVLQIACLFWKHRPDIVHCASPKGVLYGGLACRLMPPKAVVISVSGMGYAFTADRHQGIRRRLIGWLYRRLSHIAYRHGNKRVIVQNTDDQHELVHACLADDNEVMLVPGSGVELDRYIHSDLAHKQPLVVLPARLLSDKGVHEFVEACRQIRAKCLGWRFVLAGSADYRNPSAIPQQEVEAWHKDGIIEWLGHVEDMPNLLAEASIVCLPSYREGMPKSLLEAAAAGCAVITTDTTGCREAIVPGITGDLVPVRDAGAIGRALLRLINEPQRRLRYGEAGRTLAIERFGIQSVIARTLQTYTELLENGSKT